MKKTVKIVVIIAFSVYCLALIKFLFLDGRHQTEDPISYYFGRSNFIPFQTVFEYIQKLKENRINADIVIKNLLGNFIVLFPMGCFLPCLSKRCHKYLPTFVVCFAIVLIVEFTQPLLRVGYFDIDDFIFNLLGASLGFLFVNIPFVNRILKEIFVYNESL